MNGAMNKRSSIKFAAAVVFCTLVLGSFVLRGEASSKKDSSKDSVAAPVIHADDTDNLRVQGEQRFRANCGRCHAAPQKFPPRMMATVMRHMRVRATITDQDMRLVLFYMTQ
jgi:cytochrome c5